MLRSGSVGDGHRGQLFFTVSLPQAGKSTFANRWVNEDALRPRVVIGGDDFRLALHGHEYQPEAEGTVFAMMDVAARALLNRGYDVLMDETSTTEGTLRRYFRLHPEPIPIFIDTPEEQCLRRALSNNRPYLVEPIRRMARQLADLKANWGTIWARLKEDGDIRRIHDRAV